jgi:hypothetical protein
LGNRDQEKPRQAASPDDFEAALAASRFQELAISVKHALAAGALARHHDDPFDRLLVAQAQSEGLTLATSVWYSGKAEHGLRVSTLHVIQIKNWDSLNFHIPACVRVLPRRCFAG